MHYRRESKEPEHFRKEKAKDKCIAAEKAKSLSALDITEENTIA